MNITTKILSSVAVAGIVAAGSSAFTASGLTNVGATSQVVGGSVSQTVVGAELTNVAYQAVVGTPGSFDQITLTFTGGGGAKDVSDRTVTVGFGAGAFGGTTTGFTCTDVGDGAGGTTDDVSVCTPNGTGPLTALSSLTVTVNQ